MAEIGYISVMSKKVPVVRRLLAGFSNYCFYKTMVGRGETSTSLLSSNYNKIPGLGKVIWTGTLETGLLPEHRKGCNIVK